MKISVILPVRNQTEKLLNNLREKILPFFDNCGFAYDVLICSDHSSQQQQSQLIEGLKDFPAHVKLLPYEDIPGKGFAVKKAIKASNATYDLFMDADLATDLSAFDIIKPELGKYDAFIASRNHKETKFIQKQTFVRRISHWGSCLLIKMIFHIKGIKDTQCGFKCFDHQVALKMVDKQIIDGFAFDAEYCYYLYLNKYKYKEIPVVYNNDPDSSVEMTFKKLWAFYSDLRKIKKNKKSYIEKGEN